MSSRTATCELCGHVGRVVSTHAYVMATGKGEGAGLLHARIGGHAPSCWDGNACMGRRHQRHALRQRLGLGESWTSTAWAAAELGIPKTKTRAMLCRMWKRGRIARSKHRERVSAAGRREYVWHVLPLPVR